MLFNFSKAFSRCVCGQLRGKLGAVFIHQLSSASREAHPQSALPLAICLGTLQWEQRVPKLGKCKKAAAASPKSMPQL